LKKYSVTDQSLILAKIEQLADNPLQKSNVKRLVEFDVSYRLRAGNYRVLFERDDTLKIIDIIDILPRDRAYQRNR
jgi:mRNA interferase RelE/StbE